jgi:hypothetical protein
MDNWISIDQYKTENGKCLLIDRELQSQVNDKTIETSAIIFPVSGPIK